MEEGGGWPRLPPEAATEAAQPREADARSDNAAWLASCGCAAQVDLGYPR